MIKQMKELQFRILDQELNRWKREQQLAGNGAPFGNSLDTIQKWLINKKIFILFLIIFRIKGGETLGCSTILISTIHLVLFDNSRMGRFWYMF
jgi:hypothetical protein